ncbi:MAG: hypothetical protein WAU21_05875 [Chitinophagales bacterium]|nr:hypothetical protein [Bacteroidota bacterium]MBK8682819.1 hypothetical protein [Bacteroidota bacterium]
MLKTLFKIIFCISFGQTFIGCENANYEVKSEDIRPASEYEEAKWEKVTRLSLGIIGYDPVDTLIKNDCKGWGFEEWCNVLDKKVNIAGKFNRFGTYFEDGIVSPGIDATDWNIIVELFNEYTSTYDAVRQSSNITFSDWFGCIDVDKPCGSPYNASKCMFAEIAPTGELLLDGRWFPISENNHCVEGTYLKKNDTVGVFGCFVLDEAHGNQPEIHPAQQIWFRNKTETDAKKQKYWLMFIQDGSDRYEDWVASPLYGQFRIAFKVYPVKIKQDLYTPLILNIQVAYNSDFISSSSELPLAFNDCDDSNIHSLVIDGDKIITVNEPSQFDSKIGIQFSDIRMLKDGSVIGYIDITMVIGDVETNEFGASVLDLEIIQPMNTLFQEIQDLPAHQ